MVMISSLQNSFCLLYSMHQFNPRFPVDDDAPMDPTPPDVDPSPVTDDNDDVEEDEFASLRLANHRKEVSTSSKGTKIGNSFCILYSMYQFNSRVPVDDDVPMDPTPPDVDPSPVTDANGDVLQPQVSVTLDDVEEDEPGRLPLTYVVEFSTQVSL